MGQQIEKDFSYTEAVEGMERNDGPVVVKQELEKKQNGADKNICMGRKQFLIFITMVVNSAVGCLQDKGDGEHPGFQDRG